MYVSSTVGHVLGQFCLDVKAQGIASHKHLSIKAWVAGSPGIEFEIHITVPPDQTKQQDLYNLLPTCLFCVFRNY